MYNYLDHPNAMLNDLAELGIIERMVEPIDDLSLEVNRWDWAETIGIVDDLVPLEYTV